MTKILSDGPELKRGPGGAAQHHRSSRAVVDCALAAVNRGSVIEVQIHNREAEAEACATASDRVPQTQSSIDLWALAIQRCSSLARGV